MSPRIQSIVLHCLTIALLVFCIVVVNRIFGTTRDQGHLRPIASYGYIATFLLYCLKMIPFLSLPFGITNALGIILMDPNPPDPTLRHNNSAKPAKLCFRVVTKGLNPPLVQKTVQTNIDTCNKARLTNFKFEVVSDIELNLEKSTLLRELVVETDYETKYKSLYKARALTYCNEPDVNEMSDDDWIIHLDEETTLTESSAIGLANYAIDNDADIGQGVVSYANEDIVFWPTTLADSVRVAVDLGMMRFCFRVLGCPLMGCKGSFIIVKACVERKIGFDFGPKGSMAEDLMFALKAWSEGYKFNFVEGEMWEKSPIYVRDYIEQRRRWFIGHFFALLSSEIPLQYKLGLIPTDIGWFLLFGNILNVPASMLFPTPLPVYLNVTAACLGGVILFMFIFGSIKSFSIRKYGLVLKTLIVLSNIVVIPWAAFLDGVASLYGFCTRHSPGFYIVQKQ